MFAFVYGWAQNVHRCIGIHIILPVGLMCGTVADWLERLACNTGEYGFETVTIGP